MIEEAMFDRQINTIGRDEQKILFLSSVLIVGNECKLTVEIVRNLMFMGIGNCSVLSGRKPVELCTFKRFIHIDKIFDDISNDEFFSIAKEFCFVVFVMEKFQSEQRRVELENILWVNNIPFVLVNVSGSFGYMSTYLKNHMVLDSKSKNQRKDLRFSSPFGELKTLYSSTEEQTNPFYLWLVYRFVSERGIKRREELDALWLGTSKALKYMDSQFCIFLDKTGKEKQMNNLLELAYIQGIMDKLIVKSIARFFETTGELPISLINLEDSEHPKEINQLHSAFKKGYERDCKIITSIFQGFSRSDNVSKESNYIRIYCRNILNIFSMNIPHAHDHINTLYNQDTFTKLLKDIPKEDKCYILALMALKISESQSSFCKSIIGDEIIDILKDIEKGADSIPCIFFGGLVAQEFLKILTRTFIPVNNTVIFHYKAIPCTYNTLY